MAQGESMPFLISRFYFCACFSWNMELTIHTIHDLISLLAFHFSWNLLTRFACGGGSGYSCVDPAGGGEATANTKAAAPVRGGKATANTKAAVGHKATANTKAAAPVGGGKATANTKAAVGHKATASIQAAAANLASGDVNTEATTGHGASTEQMTAISGRKLRGNTALGRILSSSGAASYSSAIVAVLMLVSATAVFAVGAKAARRRHGQYVSIPAESR